MGMRARWRATTWPAVVLAATAMALACAGAAFIARADLAERRAAFETDARIAHRLLSQRVVQHDAILATLALLQPGGGAEAAPEQRLPSVYPQVLRVLRRDAGAAWADAAAAQALVAAEEESRRLQRASAETCAVVQWWNSRYKFCPFIVIALVTIWLSGERPAHAAGCHH